MVDEKNSHLYNACFNGYETPDNLPRHFKEVCRKNFIALSKVEPFSKDEELKKIFKLQITSPQQVDSKVVQQLLRLGKPNLDVEPQSILAFLELFYKRCAGNQVLISELETH